MSNGTVEAAGSETNRSSVEIMDMSRTGSTSPSTWMTSASSKAPVSRIQVSTNEERMGKRKKRTDDLEDTVNSTDVGQEVVSETSTGGSTLGETGNVDTGEESGDLARGLVEVAKPVETLCGTQRFSLCEGGERE
jgi:hypothetical protein